MKTGRHYNNKGLRQIKNGKTQKDAEKFRRMVICTGSIGAIRYCHGCIRYQPLSNGKMQIKRTAVWGRSGWRCPNRITSKSNPVAWTPDDDTVLTETGI